MQCLQERKEREREREREREKEKGKGEGSRPGQTEGDRKNAHHASAAPTCLPQASVSCKQAQGREKNTNPSRPQEEKGGRRRRKREERPDPKAAAPESPKTPRRSLPKSTHPYIKTKPPKAHQNNDRARPPKPSENTTLRKVEL